MEITELLTTLSDSLASKSANTSLIKDTPVETKSKTEMIISPIAPIILAKIASQLIPPIKKVSHNFLKEAKNLSK